MVEPREQFFQDLLSAVDQQMNTVKNDIKDIMKEKTSFIVSFENFVERYDTMEKIFKTFRISTKKWRPTL